MSFFKGKIAGAAIALCLIAAPALAAGPSPVGEWQSVTGESRYKVTMCGDGAQLCAKLTWLRKDARTGENLQYLNTYVVEGAQPAQPNKWKGRVRYEGDTFSGSLTLVSQNTLKLSGCKGIFCKSLEFRRI